MNMYSVIPAPSVTTVPSEVFPVFSSVTAGLALVVALAVVALAVVALDVACVVVVDAAVPELVELQAASRPAPAVSASVHRTVRARMALSYRREDGCGRHVRPDT
ncbi:MAG: hypothetical protein ACOYBY_11660 [Dermatophilaceae bacterium]